MRGLTADELKAEFGIDPDTLEWFDPAQILRDLSQAGSGPTPAAGASVPDPSVGDPAMFFGPMWKHSPKHDA